MAGHRYKKYVFSFVEMKDGIDSEDMVLFYSLLPDTASIVSWGDEFNRACSFFVIEDPSFDEIQLGTQLPEVNFSFEDEWKKKATIAQSNATSMPPGQIWINTSNQIGKRTGHTQWVDLMKDDFISPPNASFIAAPSQNLCSHTIKQYIGLDEKFNYCTKCGVKCDG